MPVHLCFGTIALPARNIMWSHLWSSIVADDASVTEVARGGVPAVLADTGLRMTRERVPVALAPLAVGEVPVAWRALVALATKGWVDRIALTPTVVLVAELILTACSITVTPVKKR